MSVSVLEGLQIIGMCVTACDAYIRLSQQAPEAGDCGVQPNDGCESTPA